MVRTLCPYFFTLKSQTVILKLINNGGNNPIFVSVK